VSASRRRRGQSKGYGGASSMIVIITYIDLMDFGSAKYIDKNNTTSEHLKVSNNIRTFSVTLDL